MQSFRPAMTTWYTVQLLGGGKGTIIQYLLYVYLVYCTVRPSWLPHEALLLLQDYGT